MKDQGLRFDQNDSGCNLETDASLGANWVQENTEYIK